MLNKFGDGLRLVIQVRLNKFMHRVDQGLPLDESDPESVVGNEEDGKIDKSEDGEEFYMKLWRMQERIQLFK